MCVEWTKLTPAVLAWVFRDVIYDLSLFGNESRIVWTWFLLWPVFVEGKWASSDVSRADRQPLHAPRSALPPFFPHTCRSDQPTCLCSRARECALRALMEFVRKQHMNEFPAWMSLWAENKNLPRGDREIMCETPSERLRASHKSREDIFHVVSYILLIYQILWCLLFIIITANKFSQQVIFILNVA